LAFDPTNVYKHELTYTTLSHIKNKKKYASLTFANKELSKKSKH